MIITIDGPSGSGKTTLALAIAQELHFFCMNSGYLYRGLAYVLKNYYNYDHHKFEHVDVADVKAIFQSGDFVYHYEYGLAKILWQNVDITQFLKDPEISKWAAIIARQDEPRAQLRLYERSVIADKDVVIEGRACGSVIYPEADIKFYVDASQDLRAQRLQTDQLKRGKMLTEHEALLQIKIRDEMDMSRPVEPLAIPAGSFVLDSTHVSEKDILKHALQIIRNHIHRIIIEQ